MGTTVENFLSKKLGVTIAAMFLVYQMAGPVEYIVGLATLYIVMQGIVDIRK